MPAAVRVAVVDDDASIRRAMARLLVALGFEVSVFASADELLTRINEIRPDCLLLDLHLPAFGGLDLDALLVRLNRPLPTVFMTGDEELARTSRMRRPGAACLTKPVEDETLLAAIGEATTCLARESAAGALIPLFTRRRSRASAR